MFKAARIDNTPDHPLIWLAGLFLSLAATWLLPEMRPMLTVLTLCFALGLPLNAYFFVQRRSAVRNAVEGMPPESLSGVVVFPEAAA